MILVDHRFWTAVDAVLPIIVAGLAMLGIASLALNGGLGGWMLIDRVQLRRRARRLGCSVEELMDGDDWARHNNYGSVELDEPQLAMPPSLAAHIAEKESADLDEQWRKVWVAMGGDA